MDRRRRFAARTKTRKPPDEHKRPGRPTGHPPAFRPPPQQVDDDIEIRLDECPHCGGPIAALRPCEQYIEVIPPVRPHVTRLTTYVGTCRCCGEVRSTHPLQIGTACGAAGTHLGPRALGLAAWLNKRLGLTVRSTCRVLKDLCGLKITPSGLTQALDRVADKSRPAFDRLVAELRRQPGVWVDETSWWVGGPKWWLWVFTSPDLTVYHIDSSRGRDVVLDMLGADFKGVLTSDCLASYEKLPYKMHKCYAHHLKAISQAYEKEPSDYLLQLRGLLHAAMLLQAYRDDLSPPEWAEKRRHLEDRADELLLRSTPPTGAAKVAARIRKRRRWLFTFLDDPSLEATNNRAERALRPAVIARKLSCGNKTLRGKHTWEILTSLAATCHQRGQDFLESLRPQLGLVPNPVR
ncbi:MAG: IS66 family transposase [Phycisphaerae bacterium]|nr:IS66 family transposase [Phycisphaerae bacterium]